MAVVDLKNVQGDILADGLPKFHEAFFFFKIEDAAGFCKSLKKLSEEIDDRNKVLAMWKQIKPTTMHICQAFSQSSAPTLLSPCRA